MPDLVWFRRDLRIHDHSALYQATHRSTDGVIAVFVIAAEQWKSHDEAATKVQFWLDMLVDLQQNLSNYNIPLVVLESSDFAQTPAKLVEFATQNNIQKLWFNIEYEVNEQARDEAVIKAFAEKNIETEALHDRLLKEPTSVKTKTGSHYTVFTPYKRAFIGQLEQELPEPQGLPKKQTAFPLQSSEVPKQLPEFRPAPEIQSLWKATESTALSRLDYFCDNLVADYDHSRDFPAENQTSQLSHYLAAGVLSPRQCLAKALKANEGSFDRKESGATTWISELIWREFYHQVMVGFPRICKHQPFQLKTKQLSWSQDSEHLQAWQEGKTGYPIVDAAMRQLNTTGWMHNRLRMIAAMFLSKHLFIDWREGERYFMRKLIDGDLAANNGGWQWSASTGTDSVPYFRVFNPFRQSERFDPNGKFIRRFCPELETVSDKALHDPLKFSDQLRAKVDYPAPIVEHSSARKQAIENFKQLS